MAHARAAVLRPLRRAARPRPGQSADRGRSMGRAGLAAQRRRQPGLRAVRRPPGTSPAGRRPRSPPACTPRRGRRCRSSWSRPRAGKACCSAWPRSSSGCAPGGGRPLATRPRTPDPGRYEPTLHRWPPGSRRVKSEPPYSCWVSGCTTSALISTARSKAAATEGSSSVARYVQDGPVSTARRPGSSAAGWSPSISSPLPHWSSACMTPPAALRNAVRGSAPSTWTSHSIAASQSAYRSVGITFGRGIGKLLSSASSPRAMAQLCAPSGPPRKAAGGYGSVGVRLPAGSGQARRQRLGHHGGGPDRDPGDRRGRAERHRERVRRRPAARRPAGR